MPASAQLQRLTLLLAGVSTALVQVALNDRASGAGLPLLGVSLAVAFVLWRFVRLDEQRSATPTAVVGVIVMCLLPLGWDAVSRTLFRTGAPYEVQLAYVLQNLMLTLVAAPRLPRATSNAALASFFLAVFSFLWSSGAWSVALLIVYALLGACWLLAAYWDRLGGRFADYSESAFPVRPAAASVVLLVLIAAAVVPLAGGSVGTTALAGFFPSSGGVGWNDPFAYGGVGNGDQMVAAKEQASGFGPVDSEVFLESKMPSLYDSFNEFSTAKPAKKKRSRRAIPLAPSQMQSNHQKKGILQNASREFSTVRQATPPRPDLEDRLSAALLLVSGRTPLHLGLETYDHWDGRSLIASNTAPRVTQTLREIDSAGQRWLDISIIPPEDTFTATERSQVRVINLKTDRVPTPAGTTGVTMSGLHAASVFNFASDGSLAMDVEFVPQLTIFEFRSVLRDRSARPPLAQAETSADGGRLASLAAKWTQGIPAGWPHVEAIVQRLQSHCTLDQQAMAPADTDDAVEHFLFESKRGPDYLFATSTALLLRSLGYDTRVRSGFYADPERYDRKSRLTSVLAEDAHFWVEVRSKGGFRFTENREQLPGVWLTVEPTPGYTMLYAPESLFAWLARKSAACLKVVAARPIASLAWSAALSLVIAFRSRLLDALLIGWWSLRSRTARIDGLARLTLRLLEWRAWAHRRGRPAGTPLGRWDALNKQSDFVALAGWALYGASTTAPLTARSARAVCGRAIRTRLRHEPQRSPLENPPAYIDAAEKPLWK